MSKFSVVEIDYCSGDLEQVVVFESKKEAEDYIDAFPLSSDLKKLTLKIVPVKEKEDITFYNFSCSKSRSHSYSDYVQM